MLSLHESDARQFIDGLFTSDLFLYELSRDSIFANRALGKEI